MKQNTPNSNLSITEFSNSLEILLREKGYQPQDRVMKTKIEINWVIVSTIDERIAIGAWKRRRFLPDSWGLKIYLGCEEFAIQDPSLQNIHNEVLIVSNLIINPSELDSNWIKQNPGVAKILATQGTLCIHQNDPDNGYPCKAIIPFMNEEKCLNLPVNELIGKPAKHALDIVGESKVKAIEGARLTGDNCTINYERLWDNTIWELAYTATQVSESELLLFCENTSVSQRGFWIDLVESSR